jgi:hypothetical protein
MQTYLLADCERIALADLSRAATEATRRFDEALAALAEAHGVTGGVLSADFSTITTT